MKPNISIKLSGSGNYKKNRYLYGGTGGIAEFFYDSHILYNSSSILYDGYFSLPVRHLYGTHISYGGPGGEFFEANSKPFVSLIYTKISADKQVNNKPSMEIL